MDTVVVAVTKKLDPQSQGSSFDKKEDHFYSLQN